MTSPKNIRDPKSDHLLTPENSALLIIDYQPIQVSSLVGVDKRTIVANISTVAKTAKLSGLPVVISTVNSSASCSATGIARRRRPDLLNSCLRTRRIM